MVDGAVAFFAGVYCAIVNWSHILSRACLGGEGGGGRNFLEEGEGSEIFLCGDGELDGSRCPTGGVGLQGALRSGLKSHSGHLWMLPRFPGGGKGRRGCGGKDRGSLSRVFIFIFHSANEKEEWHMGPGDQKQPGVQRCWQNSPWCTAEWTGCPGGTWLSGCWPLNHDDWDSNDSPAPPGQARAHPWAPPASRVLLSF